MKQKTYLIIKEIVKSCVMVLSICTIIVLVIQLFKMLT